MPRKKTKQTLAEKIDHAVERRNFKKAWSLLKGKWERVLDSKQLTWAWLKLMEADPKTQPDRSLLETALVRWEDEPRLVFHLCDRLLETVDGRPGDEPVPEDDPALVVIPYLTGAVERLTAEQRQGPNEGGHFWNELGRAYRLAGPEYDDAAIEAFSQALATENRTSWRFNLGLLYKNRRRWREGVELFRELFEEQSDEETVLWNLGICATAAGDAELACKAWQAGGMPATVGDDGRPSIDRLGQVKVRIPGHPEDDPSVLCFEHVWVQPLSPCHGRVLNPMLYFSEVEMNDLVLWDGQPIGYVRSGERRIPRFAMLERLAAGGWQSFRFRAEQAEGGQLAGLSEALPHASSLYVFDEQVTFVCQTCMRTGGPHSEEHERRTEEVTSVSGKLLVCPDTHLSTLRDSLEEAVRQAGVPELAVPDLYEALNESEAVEAHRKKWAEL